MGFLIIMAPLIPHVWEFSSWFFAEVSFGHLATITRLSSYCITAKYIDLIFSKNNFDPTLFPMSSPVFSLRILVMGDVGVGKSALSVRYLTRRYLGEYLSNTDVLYRCAVEVETDLVTLEILDSSCAAITNSDKATTTTPEVQDSAEQQINCQIKWSDAIIVLYSIISRASFHVARKILQKIRKIKLTTPVPIILLGNKTDIKHRRETSVNEGRKLSEEFGCQFYELSTAESVAGVSMSFDSLIREAQALRICHPKTFPRRSRTSLLSVSKMIGAMFGKATKKKRPSLSL